MKVTVFKNGSSNYKSYMKPCGHGWEVGFEHHGTPIFVGNFVRQPEATAWFRIMKKEISKFSKRYPVGKKFPIKWYQKFLTDYLYKTYYYYLDKVLPKHARTFNTKVNREMTKYRKLSRKWTPSEIHPALRKAA